MLKLYHGANSVCSIKVRIVLAEKGFDWESHHISLPKGEQFHPDFVKINPNANVPVLDHDGRLIFESSVISEYLDALSAAHKLMPDDAYLQAKTRIWGIYTLGYHEAVNTLTFASYQRTMLQAKPAEELAARWAAMPNRARALKMKDLVEHGAASHHVPIALEAMSKMCALAEADLADGWLMGEAYSLADALIAAYVYRVACLGLEPLWEGRFPRFSEWWARTNDRPSLGQAVDPYLDEAELAKIRAAGREAYLNKPEFSDYLS